MTDQRIAGYAELLHLRGRNFRPDTAVLITDSDVIECQWREILRDGLPTLEVQAVASVPACNVLRIRDEPPHNLVAIRGLEVIALLARSTSLPWLEMIRQAKPAEVVEVTGPMAYRTARICAEKYLLDFLEAVIE
jgi:hypothetical protein